MDKTKEAIEIFNKVAEGYKDKFSAMDLYDDTYDAFLALLMDKNASVLELGCGPGNISHYLLNKQPSLNILGTDLAPNMLKVAKIANPSANFELLDCRDVWKLEKKFDGIVIGFCMPYLPKEECEILIKDCARQLTPEGILYFSVIEGDNKKSGYEYSSDKKNKCFVNYHEENYLKNAISENGLELVKTFRKSYLRGTEMQIHLIMISKRI